MRNRFTAIDAMGAMHKRGVNVLYGGFRAADKDYYTLDAKWLDEVYAEWYMRWLDSLKVKVYNSKWDCDDYARLYACGIQVCWSLNRDRPDLPEGGGAAECWYTDRTIGPHAINLCFVDDIREIIFVEPQTCRVKDLSDVEIKSIHFVRL